MKKIIVTGGSGFIGSNLVEFLLRKKYFVINIDKSSYSANPYNVRKFQKNKKYLFVKIDINNRKKILNILIKHKPIGIVNLAAETHVDRSIDNPKNFITSNIFGVYNLMEAIRDYEKNSKKKIKLLHISTDEVYGSLDRQGSFTEESPYNPSSPYSASKASSDHLVNAWHKTYGIKTNIINCSNNYGPFQFPEKLIPLVIISAIRENSLPVYGRGKNIRDWLYVEDHCRAIYNVLLNGKIGDTYNVGGGEEKTNLEVVNNICDILDDIYPSENLKSYKELIKFVEDRPGHDFRYAIDYSKLKNELSWQPKESFNSGLKKTVDWYLQNLDWIKIITKDKYNLSRLGLKNA